MYKYCHKICNLYIAFFLFVFFCFNLHPKSYYFASRRHRCRFFCTFVVFVSQEVELFFVFNALCEPCGAFSDKKSQEIFYFDFRVAPISLLTIFQLEFNTYNKNWIKNNKNNFGQHKKRRTQILQHTNEKQLKTKSKI